MTPPEPGLRRDDLIMVIGSHGSPDFDELSDVDVRVVTPRPVSAAKTKAIVGQVRAQLALPTERAIEVSGLTWDELAYEWGAGTFRAWAMYRCGQHLTASASSLITAKPAPSPWRGWFESALHVARAYDFAGAKTWPGRLSDAGFLYGLARRLTIASGGDAPEAVHMSRWGLLRSTIAPPPRISQEVLEAFFTAARRIDRGLPIDPAADESIARVREALLDWTVEVCGQYSLQPIATAENYFYERLRCAERFRMMLDFFAPYMPAEYPLCTSNPDAYVRWMVYMSARCGAEAADFIARSHAILWRKYLTLPLDAAENLHLYNQEVSTFLDQTLDDISGTLRP